MLPIIMTYGSLSDTIPQLDYVTFVDAEEAFTVFANACAQAGPARCLPVSMIQGNATGSDIRLLITSTIDVSSVSPMYDLCKAELGPKARLEVAEGRIHRAPGTEWGTQG